MMGKETQTGDKSEWITIGKLDGALVDEDGLYISEATKREIVFRYNEVEGFIQAYGRAVQNSEHLALVLQRIIELTGTMKPTNWQNVLMDIEATAGCALVQWNAIKESRPHAGWREALDK